jgi:catechol 2,3-dioxygenase-like lactoylglutathione lyase family enzyme
MKARIFVCSLFLVTTFSNSGFHHKSDIDMKPRINVLTIGVDNLEKSYEFYHNGLGLASKGIVGKEFEHGAIAFFDLQNGMELAIYARKHLALDAAIPMSAPSPTEFSVGHNVRSKAEVDSVMDLAKKAGAKIKEHAKERFWGGYSGYFQDPDGHLWEVVYNPNMIPAD